MRTKVALVTWLALQLVACHGGEPRGVGGGDPIVGSWEVLNLTSRGYVTFQASGTYSDHGGRLFNGMAYAWRRESPEHISVLLQLGPVLDVRAVLTDDLRGLSLVWDTGSAELARQTTDGGQSALPGKDGSGQ